MDLITDLSPLSPGLIDELEAFMAPVGECTYLPEGPRAAGGHQLPESPPDSGSEHPYSPDNMAAPVMPADYMLVPDMPPHDMLPQAEYITYEELKSDGMAGLSNVVVLPQEQMVDLGLRSVRHELTMDQYRYGIQDLDQVLQPPLAHEPVYASLAEPSVKKRKYSQESSQVKCEPAVLPPALSPAAPRPAPSVDGSDAGDDASFQCIRFAPFQQSGWHGLYDQGFKLIPPISYVVSADKGFNFSLIDEAFVCQKKNHFQVTCQIHAVGDPQYIKTSDGFKKINQLYLHFYGVKAEDPSQEVRIEQSQSDRTKKAFHPVPLELRREGTKLTVGRLHFAETTSNNMRKKGRPNPEQRHFQLVVALRAHCAGFEKPIAAQASDRIIVRASNPGQFESDCSEGWWQRGAAENSVHFSGRVGINTDRPDEACVVNGNLKVMGHIVHPSDARAKHNIEELDTEQQLKNIQSIRVVKFNYDPSFAEHSGLVGFDPSAPAPACDTGVIAQEVRRVLPEAVKEAGDVALNNGRTIQQFLVVNKDRIFMENLGAVKELCKVTGNLESRIDQLERINKRLCKISVLQRRDSSRSSISVDSRYSAMSSSSKSLHGDNISIDHIRDIARNIRRHECCHKLSHNSPKYTRKQCKSCHSNNANKYGKYYNANKTNCVRYHKEGATEPPKSIDKRPPEEKNDTCLWVREDCGSTKTFCCSKRNIHGETEIISNKFLQIFIAILIFIMAVCLIVMSALYFHEHQALITMKEMKLRDRAGWGYASNAKYGSMSTLRPQGESGHNQIQNSKQHVTAKKTSKEKGPHKTTSEFLTTPPVLPEALPPSLTTLPLANLKGPNNYLNNALNAEQATMRARRPALSRTRAADALGGGCALDNTLNAELDADCQSSCNLDTPQSYDSQEPENLPEKPITNDTYTKPLEKPVIPIQTDRNDSKTEDMKNQLRDEMSDAESNFLDPNKVLNITDNETFRRPKRTLHVDAKKYSKKEYLESKLEGGRVRRESEVQRAGSYEFFDHSSSEDDVVEVQDCDTISFGVNTKTFNNETIFEETVCTNNVYNFTYMIPVSRCLKERHIFVVIGFSSPKSKHNTLHLCSLQCKYDTTKTCELNRELAKPARSEESVGASWRSSVTLDCNTDTFMTLRAAQSYTDDLCFLKADQKVPFVEYNIRIFRDCHN